MRQYESKMIRGIQLKTTFLTIAIFSVAAVVTIARKCSPLKKGGLRSLSSILDNVVFLGAGPNFSNFLAHDHAASTIGPHLALRIFVARMSSLVQEKTLFHHHYHYYHIHHDTPALTWLHK